MRRSRRQDPARRPRKNARPYKRPEPKWDVAPSYTGGRTVVLDGYVHEFVPEHRLANLWGFVAQHRLVAESVLGRPIARGEIVHHVDENRSNNAPENLRVMHFSDHLRHHGAAGRERNLARLTREQVADALACRSIKNAARHLHVDAQTLRNRFPDLVRLKQRQSPTDPAHPPADILDAVRTAAESGAVGVKSLAGQLHLSARTILAICRHHGFPWIKKRRSDYGQRRTTYRGKPIVRPAP